MPAPRGRSRAVPTDGAGSSTLVIITLLAAVVSQHWMWLWVLPLFGYGFAWAGHFFFEKNRPATFTHPLYSLVGDWVLWWQVISGRLKF